MISEKGGEIQGFRHVDKGARVKVDRTFDEAREGDYDAVVLPGGVVNGDAIRMVPAAREVRDGGRRRRQAGRGDLPWGWLLVSSGLVEGRTMTSWPSLQDDIRHAGGKWVDRRSSVITSRKPDDLPAFNGALIDSWRHGRREPVAGAMRRVARIDDPPTLRGITNR